MRTENQIPVHSPTADDRRLKRHHTAQYYAHRVKESLTTRVSKFICAVFLGFLCVLGIITFILWLSLRPHRPRFFIHDFSIPNLTPESGITYNVTARNSNQNIGIYYDSMQLTVYYQNDQALGGSALFPRFYQESKKEKIIAGQLGGAALTAAAPVWQQILAERARGEVVFRVEVTSVIRFKISTWNSKQHRMHANCAVHVGPDGLILPIYREKRCPVYFG